MSLFPNEDILTREIESWRTFAASLNSKEYKQLFNKMLSDCYRYANVINTKGEPFPTNSLLMYLLLSQQKMIDWLRANIRPTASHAAGVNILLNKKTRRVFFSKVLFSIKESKQSIFQFFLTSKQRKLNLEKT
jgi:hypothetical protein